MKQWQLITATVLSVVIGEASYGTQSAASSNAGPGTAQMAVNAIPVSEARRAGGGHPWQGRIPGVNPFSLAKHTEIPLIAWQAPGGLRVSFALYHNSQSRHSNPALGAKWTHSYDTHLDIWKKANGTRKAALVWGDHTVQLFERTGKRWVPRDGYRRRLKARGTNYILTLKSQEQLEFAPLLSHIPDRYLLVNIGDPNGNVLRLSYDRNGSLANITDASGRSVQLVYSNGGKLTQLQFVYGSAPRTWSFTQNNDRLLRVAWPEVTTDSGPQTYQMQLAYDANGNIIALTDRAGQTWQYGYEGNRLAWEQWHGNNPQQRLLYSLQPNGVRKLTDARGNTRSFTYDAKSRLVRKQEATGEATGLSYADPDYVWAPSLTASPSGAQYGSDYDRNGNVVGRIDPAGHRTDLRWDTRNRLIQVLEPRVTDAWGHAATARHKTEYGYDSRGNLIRVKRYTDASNYLQSEYVYDAYGQVTQFLNPRRKATRYDYDSFGNLVEITTPMGRQTFWLYEDGEQTYGFTRPSARLDGNGMRVNLFYDEWGRLRMRDGPTGTDTLYAYDGESRLVRMEDGTGTTEWTYTATGRVASAAKGLDWQLRYDYYPNGLRQRLTESTLAFDRKIEYAYTPDNELLELTELLPLTLTSSHAYDVDGHLSERKTPNGARTEYAYQDGRLMNVTHYDSANIAFTSYAYSYQENGLLKEVTEPNRATVRYGYDFLDRVVREERTGPAAYDLRWSYNEAGNRRTQVRNGVRTTYGYDDDDRVVDTVTNGRQDRYHWDANGRLVERHREGVGHQFAYDFDGRLIGISQGHGLNWQPINSYQYDGLGRRVTRTNLSQSGQTASTYRYDGASVLSEELSDHRGNLIPLVYTWGDGLISTRNVFSNQSMWSATDGFGSLRGWTDDRGQVGQYASFFNIFGEAVHDSGQRPPLAWRADAGFFSQNDAGLIYTGLGSYYDPSINQNTSNGPGDKPRLPFLVPQDIFHIGGRGLVAPALTAAPPCVVMCQDDQDPDRYRRYNQRLRELEGRIAELRNLQAHWELRAVELGGEWWWWRDNAAIQHARDRAREVRREANRLEIQLQNLVP